MSELIVKENEIFGKVRFTVIDGKEYAVANDVLRSLGYKEGNWRTTLSRKCKKDGVAKCNIIDSLGRKQEINCINEGNIYRLIVSSKLPQAEEFEKWVFEVILPAIRKDGAYIVGEEKVKDGELDEDEFVLKAMTILQNKVERLKNEKKQLEIKNKEMLPKADFYDTVLSCENTMTVNEIAKTYGETAIWLNNVLHKEKIQYKQGNRWYLYSKYANKGYVKDSIYVYGENKSKSTMKWTQKGRKFIYDLLKDKYNKIPL